jgi:hypothetical protein
MGSALSFSFGRSLISESNYSKSPNKLQQVLDSCKNPCNFSLGKLTKEHKIFTLSRKPTVVSFKRCCCENISQLKLPMPKICVRPHFQASYSYSHCSRAFFNQKLHRTPQCYFSTFYRKCRGFSRPVPAGSQTHFYICSPSWPYIVLYRSLLETCNFKTGPHI